jgi:hypothetical protein
VCVCVCEAYKYLSATEVTVCSQVFFMEEQ